MERNYRWPSLPLQKVDVPCGKSGRCEIKQFTVSERDARIFNLREEINSHRGYRPIAPGTYTALFVGGFDPMMSDTPAEMGDHVEFVERAKGDVLIMGLGIGLCVHNVLLKKDVQSVTVIEKSEDVIALAAAHYLRDKRVQIIHGDALQFRPKKSQRWHAIWHDIWPTITSDNLPSMRALSARFRNYADWQGFWCREECRVMR